MRGFRSREVTALATDIVGSTAAVLEQGDRAWRETLETHNEIVRHHVRSFGGKEISRAGDGFVLIFADPGAAACCACVVSLEVERLRLTIRAGLHREEGARGADEAQLKAVDCARRVMNAAEPGEVLATRHVISGTSLPIAGERVIDGERLFVLDRSYASGNDASS